MGLALKIMALSSQSPQWKVKISWKSCKSTSQSHSSYYPYSSTLRELPHTHKNYLFTNNPPCGNPKYRKKRPYAGRCSWQYSLLQQNTENKFNAHNGRILNSSTRCSTEHRLWTRKDLDPNASFSIWELWDLWQIT